MNNIIQKHSSKVMKDLAPSTMKTCNCCLKVDCYMDGKLLYEWFIYKAFADIIFNKCDYGTWKNLSKESCNSNACSFFLKKTYQESSELSIYVLEIKQKDGNYIITEILL